MQDTPNDQMINKLNHNLQTYGDATNTLIFFVTCPKLEFRLHQVHPNKQQMATVQES